MSATIGVSQTGIPATIQIVPGPGVAFTGQGAAGVGIAGAAIDANGHLQILRTDGVTMDAGKVAPTVATVASSGTGQASGTPLQADVSLLIAGVTGGVLVLTGGPNSSRKVVSKLNTDTPILPPSGTGTTIDGQPASQPFVLAGGSSVTFHTPDGIAWTSDN
jgi:hypothetical protein